MEQRSKEWFDARRGKITGSMIGAIMGCAPYMTREQAMRAMVRSAHNAETEFKGNVATHYGTSYEPVAVLDFQLETGLDVKECGFFSKGNYGASPDGLIGVDAVLEIKCPFSQRDKDNPVFYSIKSDKLKHYYMQVQFQMFLTERKRAYFYQWSPNGTQLEEVEFDSEAVASWIPELNEFYEEFIKELENKEHLEPLRKEVHTQSTRRLVLEIQDIDDSLDILKTRRADALAQLVEECGGINSSVAGKKLTLVKRKGVIDYNKVAKDHLQGIDLEDYRKAGSESWRLS